MNPRTSIREGLAAAACALVGAGVAAPSADAVELDASLLYYSEGSRVSVNEAIINAHKSLANDRTLDVGFTLDVMTGASANGALPSNQPQTFTRPSGRGRYIVLPGDTPADDTFQDNRVAVNAELGTPLGDHTRGVFGGHYSIEYDYLSAGGSATLTRDFNKRNTTLALGGEFSFDQLSPEGGIPVPFGSMLGAGAQPERRARIDDKIVADLLVGVTQVVNRSTIARVNYSLSRLSGYLTDPFKLLSVVDATGAPTGYVYERRPRERTRHSIYGVVKHHLARDVVDASYRYMRDDWGIRSHTVEARYRWRLAGSRYLQPQWRFYHQSATDFFAPFLVEGDPTPAHASADYRLGELDTYTMALKYGVVVHDSREINVRIGYYLQKGRRGPPGVFDSMRNLDLYPDVGAYVIQVGYSMLIE